MKKEKEDYRRPVIRDALVSHLARLANMQDFIVSQRTEASLFTIPDSKVRRTLLAILMDSREHYNLLLQTVPGLEQLREKHRGSFLQILPIKLGETEEEILINQLSVQKSLEISLELVLKFLDILREGEIEKDGVVVITHRLRRIVRIILRRQRENIRTLEKALKLYRESHIRAEVYQP